MHVAMASLAAASWPASYLFVSAAQQPWPAAGQEGIVAWLAQQLPSSLPKAEMIQLNVLDVMQQLQLTCWLCVLRCEGWPVHWFQQ